jgi:hypothetical protein
MAGFARAPPFSFGSLSYVMRGVQPTLPRTGMDHRCCMNRPVTAGILIIALGVLSGCGEKPEPTPSSIPTTTDTGSARVDPEDPKAGLNTNRPDSMKDVKPGTP